MDLAFQQLKDRTLESEMNVFAAGTKLIIDFCLELRNFGHAEQIAMQYLDGTVNCRSKLSATDYLAPYTAILRAVCDTGDITKAVECKFLS
jgi:hypothetical protein